MKGSSIPYTGYILAVTSTSLIISGLYGLILWINGAETEFEPARIMLEYGVLYLMLGIALSMLPKASLKPATAISITVAAWVAIPILASIPFSLAAGIPLIDGLFESVSGWTTTGLTILSGEPSTSGGVYVPKVEELPRTLQIWRSVMQWEGGLGIVVFTIGILAQPGISAAALYLAEGRQEKIEASVRATAARMLLIYLVLTGISILLFLGAGMSLYDAVNHALTGIATAGFSTHSDSLGYYMHKPAVLIAAMLVMFLGAVNFRDHYAVLRLRFRYLSGSVETKAQIVILTLASSAAIFLWTRDPRLRSEFTPLQMVFHIVSSSATAGFQAGNLGDANDAYKALLAVLALIGGSAFSTAGGIKILRILIALRSVAIESSLLLHPRGYRTGVRMGRYTITAELVRRVIAVITAMLAVYVVLVMTLSGLYPGLYSLADSAFEVASAMGNVGLSVGISAAAAPVGAKIILILAMLLGRLEVVAYIIALRHALRSLARSMGIY